MSENQEASGKNNWEEKNEKQRERDKKNLRTGKQGRKK